MTRFRNRFEKVENHAEAHGGWDAQDLDTLEGVWQASKRAAGSGI